MARLSIIAGVLVIFNVFYVHPQENVDSLVTKNNESLSATTGSSKSLIFYDYQTRVVAYKDLTDWQCLLEILGGESLISKWVENGSKGNVSKVFLVSRQNLPKQRIWKLAGHRIVEFCKGFPTFVIIDQNVADYVTNNEIQNLRRKRATRRYFQGRMGGQTQSQYLNFGKADQPGKAEAESTLEGSKAVVSGTSGMGQAQSQSISYGCDECYQGYSSNGHDQEQTIGYGRGRPVQTVPEHIIQDRPGGTSSTVGVGTPDEYQYGVRPNHFDTSTQNGGTGGIGKRPDTHFSESPDQFGRTHQNGDLGQIDGGGGQGGNGNGHNGIGHSQIDDGRPPPQQLPEIHGQPPQVPAQKPGQFPVRPDQIIRGPGQASRVPVQTNGESGQVTRPSINQRPDQIPEGSRRPALVPNGSGVITQVPEASRRPGPFVNGNGKIIRPDQIGVDQSERGPGDSGGPNVIAPNQLYPPGQTEIIGRPDINHRPTHVEGDELGTVINLGDSVQRPVQHGGTFGGQLNGDYQGNYGYTGRFSGQFSGQYEGIGPPSTGYTKPEGNRLVQQSGIGYQPQGGSGVIYQPSQNGQGGTQGPSSANRYHSSQPNYNNQRPISGGQGSIGGQGVYQPNGGGSISRPTQNNGYQGGQIPTGTGGQPIGSDYGNQIPPTQTNGYQTTDGIGHGTGRQPLVPGYGSQITPGQANGYQTANGSPPETGHQPLGPGYGSRTPGQLNGHQTTDQYGNGPQNGGHQNNYQPDQEGVNGKGYQPISGYGPGYVPGDPNQSGSHPGSSNSPDNTEAIPPGEYQRPATPPYYGQNGQGEHGQDSTYTTGGNGHYGNKLQGQGQGGAVDNTNQYENGNQYGVGDRGQEQTNVEGKQDFDDSDAQVQTSVHQTDNGTHAQAAAQGVYGGGTAKSQVSGTYSGSGSFSASAGSDDGERAAQTQVSGGDYGARSLAEGRGGKGNSQAEVVLSSETGDTFSTAQSGDVIHGTQSEVRASEKGGMADAQANGPGSTSSQAQIGFTPYDEKDEDNQTTPFRGSGMAGAQSGALSGMTQAQVQGKFHYGVKYVGGAQAGTGGVSLGKNSTFRPGPFAPIDIAFYPKRDEHSETQVQMQTLGKNEEPIASENKTEKSTGTDDENKNDEDQDDDEDYEEGDYDGVPETPAPKNIITQSSRNQRQHIVLDPLEDLDITVHQTKGDFPEEGTVLQPGQTIPGTSGYRIPAGFRGTVKSISNGRNTYAVGKNSQAQSVTLSPGKGRIIYRQPVYAVSSNTHYRNGQYGYGSGYTYQPAYRPVKYLLKNGKVLPNFVSVTKSETGSQNVYTGQRTPNVYYSQSSSCGVFTNHCVINAGRRLCFPKAKTNPDGTMMGC